LLAAISAVTLAFAPRGGGRGALDLLFTSLLEPSS
jgi:hypothetical protein